MDVDLCDRFLLIMCPPWLVCEFSVGSIILYEEVGRSLCVKLSY